MKTNKYVNQVLKRRSFLDFINALEKADPKEWTEIIAIHNWIHKISNDEKFDIMFDIGCGKRPTLGTYTALNTHSIEEIWCIDPQLDYKLAVDIEGLWLYPNTLEKFMEFTSRNNKTAIVCCNHAHVGKNAIEKFLSQFKSWVYITNPCCVDNRLHNHIGFHYKDMNIMSPKNDIFVYFSDGRLSI